MHGIIITFLEQRNKLICSSSLNRLAQKTSAYAPHPCSVKLFAVIIGYTCCCKFLIISQSFYTFYLGRLNIFISIYCIGRAYYIKQNISHVLTVFTARHLHYFVKKPFILFYILAFLNRLAVLSKKLTGIGFPVVLVFISYGKLFHLCSFLRKAFARIKYDCIK